MTKAQPSKLRQKFTEKPTSTFAVPSLPGTKAPLKVLGRDKDGMLQSSKTDLLLNTFG